MLVTYLMSILCVCVGGGGGHHSACWLPTWCPLCGSGQGWGGEGRSRGHHSPVYLPVCAGLDVRSVCGENVIQLLLADPPGPPGQEGAHHPPADWAHPHSGPDLACQCGAEQRAWCLWGAHPSVCAQDQSKQGVSVCLSLCAVSVFGVSISVCFFVVFGC